MKNRLYIFIVLTVLLSGCVSEKREEPLTLKVLYYSTDEFMTLYGKAYLAKNEHINFDVFPLNTYMANGLSKEEYNQIIEREQPDIMLVLSYDEDVLTGNLLNLDTYLLDKDFSLDQINTNLIAYLKLHGNGSIYALSPTFTGKATFFNRTIFDEQNIPYPTDGMSWKDILELAQHIHANENPDVTSFYYNNTLFQLANDIAATMNVHYINDEGKVTFNTESWHEIFTMIKDVVKSGAITTRDIIEDGPSLTKHAFLSGSVALTIDYSFLLDDLNGVDFNWGVANIPTNKLQESIFAMQPNQLLGVYANSEHIEESVAFLKYINSEQFAKINQASGVLSSLPSREQFSKNIIDVDLHSFYNVKPLQDTRAYPFNFEQLSQLNEQVNELLKAGLIEDKMSLEEMLEKLQTTVEFIHYSRQ